MREWISPLHRIIATLFGLQRLETNLCVCLIVLSNGDWIGQRTEEAHAHEKKTQLTECK